jgi:rSAM/selenodomain-associated transferase 2
MKLSVALLTPLPDIDRPEDLPLWCQSHGPVLPTDPDTVSVIVPTWNESANIKATLAPLLGQPGVEVIVVDGQSDDETVSIARNMGASVYLARDGRGSQLNLGASIARGEYLLFLHADTILPTDFARRVREHLSRPNVAGGAFSFDVDDRTAVPSIIRYATNARSRWFSLPFGDQAMFARASSYWKGGGCPNWPILEDVALASGLARQGRLAIDPAAVITSARRWKRLGPWRTWWINQMVLLGYFLGVSPQRLAAYYRYKNHQAS